MSIASSEGLPCDKNFEKSEKKHLKFQSFPSARTNLILSKKKAITVYRPTADEEGSINKIRFQALEHH